MKDEINIHMQVNI